jgi:hypothetical protein
LKNWRDEALRYKGCRTEQGECSDLVQQMAWKQPAAAGPHRGKEVKHLESHRTEHECFDVAPSAASLQVPNPKR